MTGNSIDKYKDSIKDPILNDTWEQAVCRELGRLSQGFEKTPGTNMCTFMTHKEIAQIPSDRPVTYAQIVVDYRPQKLYPNRVRITAGGNLID